MDSFTFFRFALENSFHPWFISREFSPTHLICIVPDVEVAIGQGGPGWVGPIVGRVKIGMIFSGQNFNSLARSKNRAGRAK